MSQMATFEMKDLDARIAAGDRMITEKRDELEQRKNALRESGVTAQSISVDEAKILNEAQKEIDALRDEVVVLRDLRQYELGRDAAMRGPVGNREAVQRIGSFHEILGADPMWAGAIGRALGNGAIGVVPSVEVLSHEAAVRRLETNPSNLLRGGPMAVAVSTDLDAGIPLDERLFPTLEILTRRIRLLDLVTVGATTSDTVVYTQQTTRSQEAAETDLGVAYPESDFDFEQVTANVRDIGHFTTAHRSQIADAGQFDTVVRRQLQEDVLLRLESQIYAGTGVGVNLKGITAFGIGSVTRDTTNETRIDCIHRAITTVRLAYREPNAVVVHPNDYQDIVFEKDQSDRHMLSAPGQFPSPGFAPMMTVWGLPLVVSPVATEGTGLLGYWPDATLWVRSGVALSVSDSHSDYFTKRQVAILAEMRGAFSVQRLGSFCKVNLI